MKNNSIQTVIEDDEEKMYRPWAGKALQRLYFDRTARCYRHYRHSCLHAYAGSGTSSRQSPFHPVPEQSGNPRQSNGTLQL